MDEPLQGIFFPNIDKLSDQWRKLLTEESVTWGAKLDRLNENVEALLEEIRALRGVTVTINRET